MSEASNTKSPDVHHNEAAQRFEAVLEGQTSVLTYRQSPGKLVLLHTEVPPALQGKGIANQLAKAAFEFARAGNLKVVPQCPFIGRYLEHHPEYKEMIVSA